MHMSSHAHPSGPFNFGIVPGAGFAGQHYHKPSSPTASHTSTGQPDSLSSFEFVNASTQSSRFTPSNDGSDNRSDTSGWALVGRERSITSSPRPALAVRQWSLDVHETSTHPDVASRAHRHHSRRARPPTSGHQISTRSDSSSILINPVRNFRFPSASSFGSNAEEMCGISGNPTRTESTIVAANVSSFGGGVDETETIVDNELNNLSPVSTSYSIDWEAIDKLINMYPNKQWVGNRVDEYVNDQHGRLDIPTQGFNNAPQRMAYYTQRPPSSSSSNVAMASLRSSLTMHEDASQTAMTAAGTPPPRATLPPRAPTSQRASQFRTAAVPHKPFPEPAPRTAGKLKRPSQGYQTDAGRGTSTGTVAAEPEHVDVGPDIFKYLSVEPARKRARHQNPPVSASHNNYDYDTVTEFVRGDTGIYYNIPPVSTGSWGVPAYRAEEINYSFQQPTVAAFSQRAGQRAGTISRMNTNVYEHGGFTHECPPEAERYEFSPTSTSSANPSAYIPHSQSQLQLQQDFAAPPLAQQHHSQHDFNVSSYGTTGQLAGNSTSAQEGWPPWDLINTPEYAPLNPSVHDPEGTGVGNTDIPSQWMDGNFSSAAPTPSDQGLAISVSQSPQLQPFYGPDRPPSLEPHHNVVGGYLPSYEHGESQGSNWVEAQAPQGNWARHDELVGPCAPCAYDTSYPLEPFDGLEDEHEYTSEGEEGDMEGNEGGGQARLEAPKKKRRQPFSSERRIEVNELRKRGACIRCQYLRESCDMGSPCGNCRKVDGKQKTWVKMPCIRMRITDAQLFRKGNSKFKQESAINTPIREWQTGARKKPLTLGRPPPLTSRYWAAVEHHEVPTFKIYCKEFVPKSGDLLHETWTEDGKEVLFALPAFAACDIEDTSAAVQGFVRDSFEFFKMDMVSEEHNPLVRLVFTEAIRYSEEHDQCAKEPGPKQEQEICMLKDALKIWILSRLAAEGFGIVGNETFDIPKVDNKNSPYYGTVPIPPILDHQLDTVGIRYMLKLKDNVLKTLKNRMSRRRQTQWYEVFLTIFVLLHNLEYVYRAQYQYMKRHEGTGTGMKSKIEFFTTTWMAEWETAAKMLITHFQVALKGAIPFTFNWEGTSENKGDGTSPKPRPKKGKRKAAVDPVEHAKDRAGMDDAAVVFMKEVCTMLRENEAEFRRLRTEGENRKYDVDNIWVSQLFLDSEQV